MKGGAEVAVRSPGLPGPVLYAATGVLAILLLFAVWRARSWSGRFIIFAVWARYIMSAYHQITFRPLFAGLSGNAVGSVAILGLGLLTVDKRHLTQVFFLPCYLMMAVIALSGLMNHDIGGLITAATKFGYLLVVAVSLYEALGKHGERQVMPLLLLSFAPLLLLQALSVVLKVAKAGESDGSISYIGGFNHEASFSIALATCLLATCFANGLKGVYRNVLIVICLGGIYLANYRTTILGIAPLVFVYFGWPRLSRFYAEHRAAIRYAAVLGAVVAVIASVFVLQDRFKDLTTALSDPGNLIRPPETFTTEERKLLSGRAFIWSTFIFAYLKGSDVQHIFGLGPESWTDVFVTYPHNTLVSYLYEYGWLGVIVIIYFWGSMFYYALKVRSEQRTIILAAHASFFLLNMATMPLWQIEGNIFYGLLCGYTLYHVRLTQAREALAAKTIGRSSERRGPVEAPVPAPAPALRVPL
jgi:hypothetical protein